MRVENQDIQERLANHPFLIGMSAHHFEILAGCAKLAQFKAGEVIFRAGEPANGFYLIESGAVALEGSVFDHAPVATDTVSAGEPLGWSWLFPPYVWHFDARATEPTTAIFSDAAVLRKHYDEDLTLANELFKRSSAVMVRRLQAARHKLIHTAKGSKGQA